jgi:phospholipid/cholesterol/gamma-HCH transport system permease protein
VAGELESLGKARSESPAVFEMQIMPVNSLDTGLPGLALVRTRIALQLHASGNWMVAHIDHLEKLVDETAAAVGDEAISVIDMKDVLALDTYGALLLVRLMRPRAGEATAPHVVNLPVHLQPLFDEVLISSRSPPPPARPKTNKFVDHTEAIGHGVADGWNDLVALAEMLGALCTAIFNTLLRPSRFRLTSAVHHLDRVGWQAVPIILLITFLIGGIIAQQGIFHFRKFGADVYVVDMVGILVLREIGVLIVAIMVAGRSGSSYTAELGSMKMREEIDALQTMGLDPVEVLVLPRVVALVIALPILTFLGSISALYGGELVAWLYGGMSPDIFVARLREAISVTHFQVGMIKAPFMALVIGLVACAQGMQVKGSAESLGLQTTSSVVKAIFLVIVLDGLFAVFFASIDM